MFSEKEFELFDGHMKGKSLMNLDMLVYLMNDVDNAYSRVNSFGVTTIGQDGRIAEGELIGVNSDCFGVLLGNSLNPLIYRGENKEYDDFVPSIDRGEYVTGNCSDCVHIIKKLIFLDWFRTTPYYTVLKDLQMNGHHMYFDFEAIAQHYMFPTKYIDVSRDINVALFFAYTYYEDGMYHPVTDFEKYKPCLYIGNMKEILKKDNEILKLISFQAVIRAYKQKAMALDLTNVSGLKHMFAKVELPQVPEVAMGIYEHFVGGELLMPTGKINNFKDVVAKYADAIKLTNKVTMEHIERYCGIYGKEINDIVSVLEGKGYEVSVNAEKIKTSEEDITLMAMDLECGMKPLLRRLTFRPVVTMR